VEILVLGDPVGEDAGADRGQGSGAAAVPLERVVDLIERSRGLAPPVVPLLDGGLVGERVFLASSAVAGASVEQVVTGGGPLAPATALELGVQLARGLAAVHRAGLTAEGLRPERVLVGADGNLRLPWVGVGSLVVGLGPRRRDDPFLAPEVRSGRPRSARQPVALAADLYAWGALLHFALLGEPAAGAAVERWQPEAARMRSIPGVSTELVQTVERCLADDPAARPADAAALVDSIGP
jgi:serine/threonine protein kinase